ncbi:hypothetical protein [Bradyrhizobium embrapense]|uniref:hypothetical protein n=1 Tax=Bradyrhizobium embrapense TaxID=630921 RepID=UPI000A7BDE6E|nr:hypothetical protein [Bradyrhizobium embrapense]
MSREAGALLCESWNAKMWAGGGSVDPLPSIDYAINAGYTSARHSRRSSTV